MNCCLSGKVIFNDPVTIYINKVADYILADEPELRKKLRFYTLKTNTPNAFSTDQGVVLVTTGLIAQLENEAQLGFILCHEIIHYIEKHVRNGYVENKNITKGRGEYSGLSYRSRISQLSKYSKDLEFEADEARN
jgi:predicted Zn-dependent protease